MPSLSAAFCKDPLSDTNRNVRSSLSLSCMFWILQEASHQRSLQETGIGASFASQRNACFESSDVAR
jgi:hypothetical protein